MKTDRETRTYRVTLVIETDTNPAKWAWDELVISDDCEALLAVDVRVVDGPAVTA